MTDCAGAAAWRGGIDKRSRPRPAIRSGCRPIGPREGWGVPEIHPVRPPLVEDEPDEG
ncbi:hypothetical protein SAMN05444583_10940 [Rhodococcus maanshanensis]|uniref:Uncharacterized protein n=1 Tax=Rhodococcus maanshanensis TaxID=183556 RepID=A0A1H7Q4Y2_9NOCA|nr:hypothetical protein SAMN05444583_10940 [Rhodococcus maanshanensis]